jgi:glycosyltransferase A (GT-A) superfamily protein (DUF2064 family)
VNVVMIARAPEPGRCKTRMIPLLGPQGAADLQAALTRFTLAQLPLGARVATSGDGVDTQGRPSFAQEGAHLGERLLHAVRTVGFPACVVGTDLPSLRNEDFAAAGHLLAQRGVDVVFGPAADGGWWLGAFETDAAATAALSIDPALWGGPQVLRACTAAAQDAGHGVVLLGEPRVDLDEPADAQAALADRTTPREIREALQRD